MRVRVRARVRVRLEAVNRIDPNAELVAQPLQEGHIALLGEAAPVHDGVSRLGDEDVVVGAQQDRKRRQMRRDALVSWRRRRWLVSELGASGSARGPGSDRPPRRIVDGGVRGVREDREKSVQHHVGRDVGTTGADALARPNKRAALAETSMLCGQFGPVVAPRASCTRDLY